MNGSGRLSVNDAPFERDNNAGSVGNHNTSYAFDLPSSFDQASLSFSIIREHDQRGAD